MIHRGFYSGYWAFARQSILPVQRQFIVINHRLTTILKHRNFSYKMPRAASPNSIDSQIARQVQLSVPGTVFTPDVFALIGSRAAIDKALQRLVARGELRRL